MIYILFLFMYYCFDMVAKRTVEWPIYTMINELYM